MTSQARRWSIATVVFSAVASGCGAGTVKAPSVAGGGLGRDGGAAGDGSASVERAPRPDRPTDLSMDVRPPFAFLFTANSSPWRASDIGPAPSPGIYKLNTPPGDTQTVFISATGSNIGGKADALSFLHVPVRGNAQILAAPRHDPSNRDLEKRAGVMVRESLDPDAAMIFVGPTGDGAGGKIIIRKAKGAEAEVFPPETAMPNRLTAFRSNQWIRVVRAGNRFSIYSGSRAVITSADAVLAAVIDLTLASAGAELLYGLAVAAPNAMIAYNADFTGAQIDNLATDPAFATLGHFELGTVLGTALVRDGKLSISAWGQDWAPQMGLNREFFSFLGAPAFGEMSLSFRVDTFDNRAPAARLGVMYRLSDIVAFSFFRSAMGAALSLTPGAGVQFHSRTSGGEETAWAMRGGDPQVKAPVWLKLEKATTPVPNDPLGARQNTITTYFSVPDGSGRPTTWTKLGEANIAPGISALGIHLSASSMNVTTAAELSNIRLEPLSSQPQPTAAPPTPDAGADRPAPRPADAARPRG